MRFVSVIMSNLMWDWEVKTDDSVGVASDVPYAGNSCHKTDNRNSDEHLPPF